MNLQRQRGASAVEFALVFVLFAALMTGLFEMTRVYRVKHSLNTATFMAARAGAVNHARIAPMQAELANNMAAIYMLGQRDAEGISRAVARARLLTVLPGIGVEIVSPTKPIFAQLQKQQWMQRKDESSARWQAVIPNDNLRLRPRQMANIAGSAEPRQINLQDANLLKVRSLWCHRLVVPALDRVIFGIVNAVDHLSANQSVCSAISDREFEGIARGFYLAIVSDAVIRMQSPVVPDDLL